MTDSLEILIKRLEDFKEFKYRFMLNLWSHLNNFIFNFENIVFDYRELKIIIKKTILDFIRKEPKNVDESYVNKRFFKIKFIHNGFLKYRIQEFTNDLFKNLYAMDSVLLGSSYSEHVKCVMVGIHRNLKADIAHNDVLLFLGIGSNEYNDSIILEDYNSMCNKFENDVSYLIYHLSNLHESLVNLSYNMEMDEPLRLRRTNAGVLLYGEFNYRFKCSFLYGIYD